MSETFLRRLFAWPALAALPAAIALLALDRSPGITWPAWPTGPWTHRLIFAAVLGAQFLLLMISRDPQRHVRLMGFGVAQKLLFGGMILALPRLGGSAHLGWQAVAAVDLLLATTFFGVASILLTDFEDDPTGGAP